MIYTVNINTDLKINTLEDLVKLKPLLEEGTLKINKSQIARELGKDRRTVVSRINTTTKEGKT